MSSTITRASAEADRIVEESSRKWGISPALTVALFVLPLVGGVLMVGSRVSRPLFHALTDEDSFLEWGQVALYVAAGVFGFLNGLRLWRSGSRWPALAWFAFVVGAVFVTGEEVSWGQRIFHWTTPEGLRAINRQAETTLHNIRTVLNGVNSVLLVGGLYGTVGWFVVERYERGKRPLDRAWLFVPPAFLSSAFLVVFAYKFARITAFRNYQFTIVRLGEYAEICFAFGLAAFAFLVYSRLRRETANRS